MLLHEVQSPYPAIRQEALDKKLAILRIEFQNAFRQATLSRSLLPENACAIARRLLLAELRMDARAFKLTSEVTIPVNGSPRIGNGKEVYSHMLMLSTVLEHTLKGDYLSTKRYYTDDKSTNLVASKFTGKLNSESTAGAELRSFGHDIPSTGPSIVFIPRKELQIIQESLVSPLE